MSFLLVVCLLVLFASNQILYPRSSAYIQTLADFFSHFSSCSDPYTDLYSLEEGEAVSVVMHNMLNKDLVKGKVRNDLGFDDDSKSHDPRTKMVLRQQKVKENREKREQELKRRRQEMESKKQARLTARQIVMKVKLVFVY